VKLRGTWDKAHWRHGAALEALGRYEEVRFSPSRATSGAATNGGGHTSDAYVRVAHQGELHLCTS
jgi:hypothetical protein